MGEYDTYCTLYDGNLEEIASDDDMGEGSNYSLIHQFSAGTTYILGVRMSNNEDTGAFNVTIERNDNGNHVGKISWLLKSD